MPSETPSPKRGIPRPRPECAENGRAEVSGRKLRRRIWIWAEFAPSNQRFWDTGRISRIAGYSTSFPSARTVTGLPLVGRSEDEHSGRIHRCSSQLPESVCDAAATVSALEESTFDSTYLEFLDEQIQLNARGDACSNRLRRRREGLAGWCDRQLIDGTVVVDANEFWVKVDPQTNEIVYWEEYANQRET